MPVKMQFSTFMKYMVINTGDKIRELEKYATNTKGVDYYGPSRKGVKKYCTGMELEDVIKFVNSTSLPNALDANLTILNSSVKFIKKIGKSNCEDLPRKTYTSPRKVFSVKLEPEIYCKVNPEKIVAVYPRKNGRLNRDQAGALIELMKRSFSLHRNAKFGIYDAHGEKVSWVPTNISSQLLDSEIDFIESELIKLGLNK